MDSKIVKETWDHLNNLVNQFGGLVSLRDVLAEASDIVDGIDVMRKEHVCIKNETIELQYKHDALAGELAALGRKFDKAYAEERSKRDDVLNTYMERREANALKELQANKDKLDTTIADQLSLIEKYTNEIKNFQSEHQQLAKTVEAMNVKHRQAKGALDKIKAGL